MARGLMMVLAFATTVAQAQEATKAGKGTNRAAPSEGELRATVLTPPPVSGPRTAPLSRSTVSRAGGVAAGSMSGKSAPDKRADCSGYNALLNGAPPVVRTYAPPSLAPDPNQNAWRQPPYVGAIERCDNLYLVQVVSRSMAPWIVSQARVEGPNGEALHVHAFGFKELEGKRRGINVIVAEAPPGVRHPNLTLHLVGENGRVAQVEARNVP